MSCIISWLLNKAHLLFEFIGYLAWHLLISRPHMKKPLKCTLVALVALCFASALNANLILLDTYKINPQNTPNIVSVASAKLGAPDLESFLRLDNLALPPVGGPFTIEYTQVNTSNGGNPNNGANISWDLTGTGFNLLGVYVYGGSRGANLYKVDDLAQLIAGSATVNTPLTGNSGKYATISHMLFLGTSGHSVPEAGSTLGLLALAIGWIGVGLRKFRA